MYYRDTAARFRLLQAPPTPASVYDLVVGLKGRACHLSAWNPGSTPGPVWTGFIEEVSPLRVAIGVAGELPADCLSVPYRVETMSAGALVRFQSSALHYARSAHLELTLPNQVETIQRRQFARIPVHIPVAYTDQSGTVGGIGHAIDISVGGLLFETEMPPPQGRRIFVSFQLPEGPALRGVDTQVVRLEGRGMRQTVAVRFERLEAEQTEVLAQGVLKLAVQTQVRRY